VADDGAFDATDLVEIDNDTFAEIARNRREDRKTARRYIDRLSGVLPPRLKHIAAQQLDGDTLVAASFDRFFVSACYGSKHFCCNVLRKT
jgi:hypothetical protein